MMMEKLIWFVIGFNLMLTIEFILFLLERKPQRPGRIKWLYGTVNLPGWQKWLPIYFSPLFGTVGFALGTFGRVFYVGVFRKAVDNHR